MVNPSAVSGVGTVTPVELPGVDARLDEQLRLAAELARFYPELPFGVTRRPGLRYELDDPTFGYGDGVALYAMLRYLRPRRYLELGSGASSACALDTAQSFLPGLVLRFLEPHPSRLNALLRSTDRARVIVAAHDQYRADDFADLEPGDVLFVDPSNAIRHGLDLDQLLNEVIPRLPVGVLIHLHEVTWPVDGLRPVRSSDAPGMAVLNKLAGADSGLRILWCNDYLRLTARSEIAAAMPLWGVDPGSSMWLERI